MDEEAVGSVGSPGCGAKILKGDDVTQQHFEQTESNVSVVQHVLTRVFCESWQKCLMAQEKRKEDETKRAQSL